MGVWERDEGRLMTPLLVLLGTIAGAWYLLIVRPQKDQQTRHGRLVERLQVGDHVLTVGGIYGRVVAIEPATVVLELAPGLTSRIATDGIARIVHGAEAALPTDVMHGGAPTSSNPPQAMEEDMHQQPGQPQHPQHPAPAQQPPVPHLPQQPFAHPQPVVQPQPVMQHAHAPYATVAPPMQLAPPPPPVDPTRAHVLPQAPTFEPRPWGDVQPRGAQQPVHHAQPVAHAQPQPQPIAYPQHVVQQQPAQYAAPAPAAWAPPAAPATMPVHVPFAQHAAPVAQPVVHAMQPQHAPVAMPQPIPALQPVQVIVNGVPEPQHAPPAPDAARRHSRAPKGMGSSLRLDDPSLRDTISRARDERADLAQEYRKLTAPLVDVGGSAPADPGAHPGAPQLVGHDPTGVPLFATPGVPGVHPIAQYPAPARIASDQPHGLPRPVIDGASVPVDQSLHPAAFQRPTPYAPARADSPPLPPQDAHAHAHA